MGGPIVTGPSPDGTRDAADHIVVSVGPYIFQSFPRAASWLARSRGKASPPQRILNSGEPFQPTSSNIRQVAGVACMAVAPVSDIFLWSKRPSIAVSRLARISWAPE